MTVIRLLSQNSPRVCVAQGWLSIVEVGEHDAHGCLPFHLTLALTVILGVLGVLWIGGGGMGCPAIGLGSVEVVKLRAGR
jgi:hypothetical protein